MRNFHICLALAAVSLMSCEKDTDPEPDGVTFSVVISDIGSAYAGATITHDGTNRDRYCAFLLQGRIDDPSTEIIHKVRREGGTTLYSSAMSQRKKVIRLGPLSPSTEYTYVVFGIDEDGETYGRPGVAVFTTGAPSVYYLENPSWELTCIGESFYENAYWTCCRLIVTGQEKERCLVWMLSEDEYSGVTDAQSLVYKALNSYREANDDYDEHDLWADNEWIVSGSTRFFFKKEPGNYMTLAIGIEADGTPTGHYARTEPFYIGEYTANGTYTQYYGDWKLSDASGKSYDVSITKKKVNTSLYMTGICGENYPLVLNVSENTGIITIYAQTVRTGGQYRDADGDVFTADAKLRGWYSTDGSAITRASASKVSVGMMQDDGTVSLSNGFELSDVEALSYGFYFKLYDEDGTDKGYLTSSKLVFPITLKRR